MTPTSYPRDLIGYGAVPPLADWPGGVRLAVQFVLNDDFAERYHDLAALDLLATGDSLVIDRIGPGENCDVITYPPARQPLVHLT